MCRAVAGVFSLAPFRTKRCHEAVDHLAAKLLGMKVMTLLGCNGAAADEFDFGSGASFAAVTENPRSRRCDHRPVFRPHCRRAGSRVIARARLRDPAGPPG